MGRIEEDYAGSRSYQHALEIIRNATQQTGTTYVCSDIVVMPHTGVLKRAFINNGPALTESELESYMTTIGEGEGDLWRLDNTLGHRHAGARTAVLPWTNLLVPVLGRHEPPRRPDDEALQKPGDQRIRVHAGVHT